ncbi:hypothetical protein OF83DRAFT_354179 [Amylostereum chailletii]|nr:hypothetical protein OF83DRAFT_354179 [Amylostereum chailletii]
MSQPETSVSQSATHAVRIQFSGCRAAEISAAVSSADLQPIIERVLDVDLHILRLGTRPKKKNAKKSENKYGAIDLYWPGTGQAFGDAMRHRVEAIRPVSETVKARSILSVTMYRLSGTKKMVIDSTSKQLASSTPTALSAEPIPKPAEITLPPLYLRPFNSERPAYYSQPPRPAAPRPPTPLRGSPPSGNLAPHSVFPFPFSAGNGSSSSGIAGVPRHAFSRERPAPYSIPLNPWDGRKVEKGLDERSGPRHRSDGVSYEAYHRDREEKMRREYADAAVVERERALKNPSAMGTAEQARRFHLDATGKFVDTRQKELHTSVAEKQKVAVKAAERLERERKESKEREKEPGEIVEGPVQMMAETETEARWRSKEREWARRVEKEKAVSLGMEEEIEGLHKVREVLVQDFLGRLEEARRASEDDKREAGTFVERLDVLGVEYDVAEHGRGELERKVTQLAQALVAEVEEHGETLALLRKVRKEQKQLEEKVEETLGRVREERQKLAKETGEHGRTLAVLGRVLDENEKLTREVENQRDILEMARREHETLARKVQEKENRSLLGSAFSEALGIVHRAYGGGLMSWEGLVERGAM